MHSKTAKVIIKSIDTGKLSKQVEIKKWNEENSSVSKQGNKFKKREIENIKQLCGNNNNSKFLEIIMYRS